MIRAKQNRSKSGVSIVEFAAAVALGLPLILVVIYAALEANYLFTIRTNLDVACRRAAQLLINDYLATGVQQANVSNGNLPSSLGFDVMTADGHYFINRNANQFTWTWDSSTRPTTVTVTVKYPTTSTGANGLLPFPYPDPLRLGGQFKIYTTGTFSAPSS